MKPTVILFQAGPRKLFLNLLSVLSLRFEDGGVVVVTNLDDLRVPRQADAVRRKLRERYNLVTIGADGVSTTHGTSRRSSRTAVLAFTDSYGTEHVVFQRGLKHLKIGQRNVTVSLVRQRCDKIVNLSRPLTSEGLASLEQLGLA